MSAPSSVEEFLDLVQKSRLVEFEQLVDCIRQRGSDAPATPRALAELLTREELLSPYQAAQLLRGNYKFFIGPYKIVERLGAGAVSNVYLCERPVTRAPVAIKLLAALQGADPTVVPRFYREARAAASLVHPNIVRAGDVDEAEQGHFMVMDFVDGSSIQEIVAQVGPMDFLRTAHYLRQAALGLQHAHEKGLVHRDVKPANLLIDREGTVKILDMGLARFCEEGGVLTKGVVLGTPDYLAPEQAIDSHNVDTRADVYGLGATGYFMLTGQPPYAEEKTVPQKLIGKQSRDPTPIRTLCPEVPKELAAVIEKMMARDPALRFKNPGAAATALGSWACTSIPPPPEEEMPQRKGAASAKGCVPEPLGLRRSLAPVSDDRTPAPIPTSEPIGPLAGPGRNRSPGKPVLTAPSKPVAAAQIKPTDSNHSASEPKGTPLPSKPAPAKRKSSGKKRRRRRPLLSVVEAVTLLVAGLAVLIIGYLIVAFRN